MERAARLCKRARALLFSSRRLREKDTGAPLFLVSELVCTRGESEAEEETGARGGWVDAKTQRTRPNANAGRRRSARSGAFDECSGDRGS